MYFNASLAPATTLETAALTLSIASEGVTSSSPVPSGAYGSIKLWDEINVTASATGVSPSNFKTIASWGQNLSCPAGIPITATLSNTPDGNGYILVDNYITLSVNGIPVNNGQSGNNPPGNVCFGGPADSNGGVSFNDCFSSSYQGPAAAGTLNGQDPDTFANPGNAVLSGAAGGLPPINLTAFLDRERYNLRSPPWTKGTSTTAPRFSWQRIAAQADLYPSAPPPATPLRRTLSRSTATQARTFP